MKLKKIVVIGSLNMDLVVNTPRIPALGETVLGSGFFTAPGGKGANQAVAAARLGGSVSIVGCVGDDIFGKELKQNLLVNDVDIINVKVIENTPTGVAMITVKDGDNFIIVDPGANFCLTTDIIDELEDLIKDSFLVVIQLEIPFETVERAVESAHKHGVKVLLNPAPARTLPDDLLEKIDIITPNEKECELITGLPVRNIDDAKAAVSFLMQKGIPQVVITMGSAGAVYNNGSKIMHKSAVKVKAVDTTAAGDSFSGAISVALTEGKSIDEAIDFANLVGALTVTKKGAQLSLPMRKNVDEMINKRM